MVARSQSACCELVSWENERGRNTEKETGITYKVRKRTEERKIRGRSERETARER